MVRSYEASLRLHVLPALGSRRCDQITPADLHALIDRLSVALGPATVRNAITPLRSIYRYAVKRGEIGANPTRGLDLPSSRGRRDRIAAPCEARALLEVLGAQDRTIYATAIYAGLRRGELRALAWDEVDLVHGVLHIRNSWDRVAGLVAAKSVAGERPIPLVALLHRELEQHCERSPTGLGVVFPATDRTKPFDPTSVAARADRAWEQHGLNRITLHECRHTFASLMIAAGIDAKALSTYMGHSSITITYDRYGHLFPGSRERNAGLLNAYLSENAA